MTGDVSDAVDLLLDAADVADEGGQRSLESSALHDLARLGEAKLVAERLATVVSGCDGPIAPPRAAFAMGLARTGPALLPGAGGCFEALGAWLHAAESFAAAAVVYRPGGRARRSTAGGRLAADLR